MAVRSRRVLGPTTLGLVVTTLYTVPAGRTLLVRSHDVHNRLATAQVWVLYVNGSTAADVIASGSLAGQTSQHFDAVRILNPGDTLRGNANIINAIGVTVYGSLLDGEPE